MSQLDDVKALADVMREKGIRRASMTRDGVEVELFGEAPRMLTPPNPGDTFPFSEDRVPPPPEPPPLSPEARALLDDGKPQVCACGHQWSEHNETGCLAGCSMASCGIPEAVPPEAKPNA